MNIPPYHFSLKKIGKYIILPEVLVHHRTFGKVSKKKNMIYGLD
jgi:hypothetical protein